MKFDVIEREPVLSSKPLMTKEVKINANAKAFKLLFGQIYPDIIKAIVRELFANAWDSHKSIGKLNTHIDIHIPTIWEPYFSIRDYGTGMSPELIENIYCNIFESTKDLSNDQAGMFGMGSKTPLGYTDLFSVTSYYDGVMYVYDIYVDHEGKPHLDLKMSNHTDEPNGVLVSLGVKNDDFNLFKQHVENFIITIGTPINVNNQKHISERKIFNKGNRWECTNNINGQFFIKMGCILYPIDEYAEGIRINQIIDHPSSKYSFIMEFDIGEFDVTGSREDIIYNKQSCNKINQKAQDVYDEFIENFKHDINNTNCLYDKIMMYNSYCDILGGYSSTLYQIITDELDKNRILIKYCCDINGIDFNNFTSDDNITNKKIYNVTIKNKYVERHLMLNKWKIDNKNNKFVVLIIDYNIKNRLLRQAKLFEMYPNNNFMVIKLNKHVKSSDYVIPKRLKLILPQEYDVVNFNDIKIEINNKPKVVRRKPSEKNDKVSYKTFIDNVLHETSRELSDGDYYTDIPNLNRIFHANAYLKINDKPYIEGVTVIPKYKRGLIKKYNLINIDDVYGDELKLTSNDIIEILPKEVIYNLTLSSMGYDKIKDYYCILYTSTLDPTVCKILGLDYNTAIKYKSFSFNQYNNHFLCQSNEKWMEECMIKIQKFITDLQNKHDILKYISNNTIGTKLDEITKLLGE